MKLGIKTYRTNYTLFGDDGWMDVDYEPSLCELYTTEEFLAAVKDDIVERFGQVENIDEVLLDIGICVDPFCKGEE